MKRKKIIKFFIDIFAILLLFNQSIIQRFKLLSEQWIDDIKANEFMKTLLQVYLKIVGFYIIQMVN